MSSLFGTSGVRGKINEELTPEVFHNIGRAYSHYLENFNGNEIIVGRDTRTSGELVEGAIISAFISNGFDISKLGIVPTPVLAYSTKISAAVAGVMITASHNPSEYNGVKLFNSDGEAVSPEKEDRIENIYDKLDDKAHNLENWSDLGVEKQSKSIDYYKNHILDQIHIENKYSIAIDCGNGPSSKTTPKILRELGCNVTTVNSQKDGFFPGRSPEPTSENLEDLKKLVRGGEFDLGVAHDGDGDRLAIIDEEGNYVNQDDLLALMGKYYAEKFDTGTVTTIGASSILEEMVEETGKNVVRTKVGDVFVAKEMKDNDFMFGGEPSGSWIMGDFLNCPDGTFGALRVLEILDNFEGEFSQLVDQLPSYPIFRSKIQCPDENKSDKMKKLEKKIKAKFSEISRIITVDGLRIDFEDKSWILIRPSGTEPYIRITVEGKDKERVEELKNEVLEIAEKI